MHEQHSFFDEWVKPSLGWVFGLVSWLIHRVVGRYLDKREAAQDAKERHRKAKSHHSGK